MHDAAFADAADARCPAAFSSATEALACEGVSAKCAGTAVLDGEVLRLTSAESSKEVQTGVYWRRLGLPRASSFTLTVDLSIQKPVDGARVGHGFALVFAQGDVEPSDFPGVRGEKPDYMGINVLEGFHGAGAYVKTFDTGMAGVLALRATQIPSAVEGEVDDWRKGLGNDESFGPTDDVFLRFVVEVRPDTDPTFEMLRFDDASFATGHPVETVTVPLLALDRFDYFGIAATRGDDGFSQSGGSLEAASLTCPD